jgi:histidine triad (HIT) family protein
MKKQQDETLEALKSAARGLRMPSETDAPFEVFAWEDAGKLTPDLVLRLTGEDKGTAVEESSLDELFATVPSEDKARFQKLRQALREQLGGVRVYKVGDEAERLVYVVGKAKDGRWAGLKTAVVET